MLGLRFRCELSRPAGFRLSAEFECGDGVTALVGPSGSGKTTVLGLIAGLLRPTSGVIRLGERTVVDTAARLFEPPERRNVGLVFQDDCLFPHLTVQQNLDYGWKRRHRTVDERRRVVEVLELGALLDRSPLTLSGGQKQRVALGRALLQGPQLLLLDEPLAGLDEPLQERVLTFLKHVLEEYRLPTILVTHSTAHVEVLARTILTMRDGTIVGRSGAESAGGPSR